MIARWIFVRALGLILLSAFISIWVQIHGLIGSGGVLPLAPYLESAEEALGTARFWEMPSLFWISASDFSLHLVSALGVFFSLAVTAGVWPRGSLFACWALYLSIGTASRVFLGYQWDILLLEVAFTAILFAPRGIFPGLARDRPASRASLLLLYLLLFKLMFSSGFVKLSSGDATWRHLTALDYHYQTQPLPTWIGWYAHQLPQSFHHFSVLATFFIQLVVPFAIFGPRPLRLAACASMVFLQVLIALTGNYCFFNLIALALCVVLLDDRVFARWIPAAAAPATPAPVPPSRLRAISAFGVIALIVVLDGLQLSRTIFSRRMSDAATELMGITSPFRTINSYGLFAVMTTKRHEIILEGSDDGATWLAYELPHQPGDLSRRPSFVAPHQPRVDWQMWFAALGSARQNPWLQAFVGRLLQGSPDVLELVEHNPFPERPPRYIRAETYEYRFTDPATKAATGAWWQRTYVGSYLPARGLR